MDDALDEYREDSQQMQEWREEAEEFQDPSGLYGKCVEIVDMEFTYARTIAGRECDRRLININGQKARCGKWLSEEQKYGVQTFEGVVAVVPAENLREVAVPETEDGGFDLMWPFDEGSWEEMSEFAEMAAHCLSRKGYCMIQTFTTREEHELAKEAAELCPDLRGQIRREIESSYLGYNNTCRLCSVGNDDGNNDIDPSDTLAVMRRQFTLMWQAFAQHSQAYLGITTDSWSSVFARPPVEEDDDQEAIAFGTTSAKEDTAMVESHDQFIASRTVCALHMLDNEGGEVRLCPRHDQQESREISVPLAKNRMLLFRHDLMSYSYLPIGQSIAFQNWLLGLMERIEMESAIAARLTGVRKPPRGAQAQIMATHIKEAGNVDMAGEYWSMFVACNDCAVQWPSARWPTEPYYTESDQWAMEFKAYTKHGSFMEQDQITCFDNGFFGLTDQESMCMCPGQRLVLEVGYTTLKQAGHSRASLDGENIGVCLGDVGIDWHSAAPGWSFRDYGNTPPDMINEGLHVQITSTRISHLFNMVGPANTVDTACSASLVAMQSAHKQMLFAETDKRSQGAISAPHSYLSGGVNTLVTPISFVGNCSAGMLSHVGRCWTFDRTADGYQRGEGCGFVFIKWSSDEMDQEERLCCLMGSCANHDGKSASLTAPNGPSQQDCIRRSMRMAEVDPSLISVAECHGTGTALGDPIEVGALQGVMRGMRTFPLYNTSSKSNISHGEANAGIAGVIKCIQMVVSSCCPPNCHLRVLNPNLEGTMHDGYPVYFSQEIGDCLYNTTCLGVSSFGFGGTNSRADLYGRCLRGPRDTGNVWTQERIAARNEAIHYAMRNSLRGMQLYTDMPTVERHMYIVGTWNGYKEKLRMWNSSPGIYIARITLGDTRSESFKILQNGDPNLPVYPAVHNAGCNAIIQGPDEFSNNRQWQINGYTDGACSGTTYKIRFEWRGFRKFLSWEVDDDVSADAFVHRYELRYPQTRICEEMRLISPEEHLYEGELRIMGLQGTQFQIRRDRDDNQLIYPTESSDPMDKELVVRGPDALATAKGDAWLAQGELNQVFRVQLSVWNGKIAVHLISPAGWYKTSMSAAKSYYYVTGSFNQWKLAQMVPDRRVYGLFRYHLTMNDSGSAQFQVMLDAEGTGEATTLAKDGDVEDQWQIETEPGSDVEIFLDLNQDDVSRRVYWRASTAREKHLIAST